MLWGALEWVLLIGGTIFRMLWKVFFFWTK
jgi:hypothetical protein